MLTQTKVVKIKNHFFKLTFSFKKKELSNTAKGIANCDPIIIGDTIAASFRDKVINKLAIKPMQMEKKNKGSQYFFSGILNFQKGIRQIKTIPILIEAINIGGRELFKINLPTG